MRAQDVIFVNIACRKHPSAKLIAFFNNRMIKTENLKTLVYVYRAVKCILRAFVNQLQKCIKIYHYRNPKCFLIWL